MGDREEWVIGRSGWEGGVRGRSGTWKINSYYVETRIIKRCLFYVERCYHCKLGVYSGMHERQQRGWRGEGREGERGERTWYSLFLTLIDSALQLLVPA